MMVTLAGFQESAVARGFDKRTVQEFVFHIMDLHGKMPNVVPTLREENDWQRDYELFEGSIKKKAVVNG